MRYHRCLGYSGGSSLTVSHFKQYGFPMVLTFVFSRSSNTAGENVPSASFFFWFAFLGDFRARPEVSVRDFPQCSHCSFFPFLPRCGTTRDLPALPGTEKGNSGSQMSSLRLCFAKFFRFPVKMAGKSVPCPFKGAGTFFPSPCASTTHTRTHTHALRSTCVRACACARVCLGVRVCVCVYVCVATVPARNHRPAHGQSWHRQNSRLRQISLSGSSVAAG